MDESTGGTIGQLFSSNRRFRSSARAASRRPGIRRKRSRSASSVFRYPPMSTSAILPGAIDGLLYNGAKFRGSQKSRGSTYKVEVELKHVDLAKDYICGYLKIKNLTEEYPTLVTCFDGEIVGRKHPFLTRKWEVDHDIDRKHWERFPQFTPYKGLFNNSDFDYDELKRSPHIFMRWKELFLVPNHHIQSIPGASFTGFYYICLDKTSRSIDGLYYHKPVPEQRNESQYQNLQLEYVPRKSIPVYQFR